MSVRGNLEKVWRPSGDGSLTIMTVVKDGLSRARRSIVDFPKKIHRKRWETLRNRVTDNQNGYAGWTVVPTTVHRMCPLVDT